MRKTATTTIIFMMSLVVEKVFSQKQFGNEWIKNDQSYFRIPVSRTGMYEITGQDLQNCGIALDSLSSESIQLFRRGRELAIEINKETEKLSSKSSFRFYGERNNGALDSSLYVRADAMPHPYYSLYSDTSSYFLTWQKHDNSGKRIQSFIDTATSENLEYHITESMQLYNAFYSVGKFYPPGSSFDTGIALSTYDVGEGWTGPEIKDEQWGSFPIQTENVFRDQFQLAKAEITMVGRTAGSHEVEIWTGAPGNLVRKLSTVSLVDYNSARLELSLNSADLSSDGKVIISVKSAKNTGSVSVSAIRWKYPQKSLISLGFQQKEFHFEPEMKGKKWSPKNQTKSQFYDCTDPYNLQKIEPSEAGISISGARKLIGVNEFFKPFSINPVYFKNVDSAQIDYLIISHPAVRDSERDPVVDYASYRSSKQGGGYRTFVINSQEIYDEFSYGEPGPLGIRNLIDWLITHSSLKFVFIIGKSIDPQTARKSSNPRNQDQVPNAGWPGSDLALAMTVGEDFASYIPKVPVGRINADSPEQVRIYLKKVMDMEAQPASAPWRKNILHLSGGRSENELNLFREYVHLFAKKIENSQLGASISTISKKTDDPVEQFPLDQPINKGIALMTLFGHSGLNVTDVDIGYASDLARNFKNSPFYPAIIVNGCATGSIFYTQKTISSDWIFAPERGSVLFLANTFNGVSTALKRYTESFYEVLADSNFMSEPFGNIQKEAIHRNMLKSPGIADKIAAQQMTLQGDPAIRIFPATLPDFAIDSASVIFSTTDGKLLTSRSDSIKVSLKIVNYGRIKNIAYQIAISRKRGFGMEEVYTTTSTAGSDFFEIKIPNDSRSSEPEVWTFTVDPEDKIHEENEKNNFYSLEMQLPEAGAFSLLPPDGYVSTTRSTELIAQVISDKKNSEVIFEWDYSDAFLSPHKINAIAEQFIARQQVNLPVDGTKIFWRVYLEEDEKYPSKHRSLFFSAENHLPKLPEAIVYLESRVPEYVQEGEIVKTNLIFQNVTDVSFSDSLTIQMIHKSAASAIEKKTKIAPLEAHEIRVYPVEANTLKSTGQHLVTIKFNYSKRPEEIYTNNTAAFSFNVIPDLIPPVLSVSIDHRQISDLEVVTPQPMISVQLYDENSFFIRSDTTGIELWLTRACTTCSARKLDLKHALTKILPKNIFEINIKPDSVLANGTYILLVKAKDASANMAHAYSIRFRVQNMPALTDAGVSPNPARQWFRFYLSLEGYVAPEKWNIKVKDKLGREIISLETRLHLGQNEMFWNPGIIPAGIYFYEMTFPDTNAPAKSKQGTGLRGKLVWMP